MYIMVIIQNKFFCQLILDNILEDQILICIIADEAPDILIKEQLTLCV